MQLQAVLRPVVRVALAWYYRSITVANSDRIPRDGPIFVAVNHPNALVDALVAGTVLPRPLLLTAKATIFTNPLVAAFLTRAGVVPLRRASDEAAQPGASDASRNQGSFAAVADALERGGAVLIFPEGKSHDEPRLAPLRTGLARMALMARDDRVVRGIRIVPVGLLFERKEEPRSRVLVQIGDVYDVDSAPRGPDAVAAITDAVTQRLEAVTLNFDSPDDAARIQAAADTLAALVTPIDTIDGGSTLRDALAIVRRADRVNRAIVERNDPALTARAQQAEERLAHFRARLAELDMHAEDIGIDLGAGAGARFVLREVARAVVVVPVSLWGRFTHWVPVRLARALATRSVQSRDEPAMRTLVIGLVLVLAAYATETAIVAVFFGWWWAFAFLVTLVPSASSDFRYGDRARRLRARARTYRTLRRDPALRESLLAEADWLRREAGTIERLAHGA